VAVDTRAKATPEEEASNYSQAGSTPISKDKHSKTEDGKDPKRENHASNKRRAKRSP
jgi:hypothetical protein